jgi:hypothetical protein
LRKRKKTVKGVIHKGKKNERKWKYRKTVRRLKKVGERWVDPVVPISIAASATKDIVIDFAVPIADVTTSVNGATATWEGAGSLEHLVWSYTPITHTTTVEPARVTLHIPGAAEVHDLSVTGVPYFPIDEAEATVTVTGGAREASSIDNEYVPSAGDAAGLAEYLTWRYGSGRLRPEVTDQHHPTRQLELDVGSHVELSADRWYIDADRYIVRSLEHSVSHAGLEWETTFGLEELPSVGNWFRLDSSLLDGSDVLAY